MYDIKYDEKKDSLLAVSSLWHTYRYLIQCTIFLERGAFFEANGF